MPKKSLISLTEQMLYILMSIRNGSKCGTEMVMYIKEISNKRIKIGPATLYTLLAKFLDAGYIIEVAKEEQTGRKRSYALSKLGLKAYADEIKRLQSCLKDARYLEANIVNLNNGSNKKVKANNKYRNPGSY